MVLRGVCERCTQTAGTSRKNKKRKKQKTTVQTDHAREARALNMNATHACTKYTNKHIRAYIKQLTKSTNTITKTCLKLYDFKNA